MEKIKEHLNFADIRLTPGKLELVHRELGAIMRSPNLVPQSGRLHESVWHHTGSMLDENLLVFREYPRIVDEVDFAVTVGGITLHDIPEGFTVLKDLNYADSSHNGDELRREKENTEYLAIHHFIERNVIGRDTKLMLHQFSDEWSVMESTHALYVRLHDMVDGNKAVIHKAMDLSKGVIQKLDSNGIVRIWPIAGAGGHIANIAATKTFPVVEKLVHRLKRKDASLAILHWFNSDMMRVYDDAGWGYLPVIKEMQRFLDIELKGYEL